MEKLSTLLQKFREKSTTQDEYNTVDLTEEEKNAALLEAKEKKYWQLKENSDREAKLNAVRELTRPWSFDEMKKAALTRANQLAQISGHPAYLLDEYTTPVFNLLCQYFTNDPEFEKDGRSLKKGIMLLGNVGVGKTDILRAFEFNRVQCFQTITCSEISGYVKEKNSWAPYIGYIPGHGKTAQYFLQSQVAWMFDDMGTEEPINNYGTKIDPLPTILMERYKLKGTLPFSSLHLTTNMNGDMIQERYDLRVRSRIREMYNIIQLHGTDRRV